MAQTESVNKRGFPIVEIGSAIGVSILILAAKLSPDLFAYLLAKNIAGRPLPEPTPIQRHNGRYGGSNGIFFYDLPQDPQNNNCLGMGGRVALHTGFVPERYIRMPGQGNKVVRLIEFHPNIKNGGYMDGVIYHYDNSGAHPQIGKARIDVDPDGTIESGRACIK